MRGKKTIINTAMSLLEEFVAVICGFILPRLILMAFGSKYNGLTTSITQFLACAVLLRSGIGGATRAALYKPLAESDSKSINAIMKATDNFMKKIGLILAGAIVSFAAIYPFLVRNDFGWLFTFSLFLIIGLSTFAESFFGITYLILLQADQRLWISSLLKSVCYILNTVIAAILIYNNCSIHIVKLGSAAVFVAYPIALNIYVKRRYKIDTNVEPDNKAIAQRWDAFWHQVAVFVMSNTDVMVLTIFTNMIEVSIYSVYNLVINGLKKVVFSFSNGIEAAFGNMIAKKEQQVLKENVSLIEWVMYSISTLAYTCAIILILQFINIYTAGITDADYRRPAFAYILLVAQFFNCIRLPYQLVVQAAGHYKQTKNGAIVEPIINIVLSVIMVIKFGLVGVAIGTLAATIFRTIQFSGYMCKNILRISTFGVWKRIVVSVAEACITILLIDMLNLPSPENYFAWIQNAIITVFICSIIVLVGSIIFFKSDVNNFGRKLKSAINKAR